MVSNLPECIAQIQGGRLRPLAVTSAARHPLIPEVPTVREAGQPGLEMTNWTAMMVPAAVPQPILARIEADTLAAIRDPEVGRRAREGGFTVEAWDRARSLPFVTEETARWARLIQDAGLRAD
jgi:tripartite-type tricarboxylate transporter receptor subunit TctC